MVMMGLQLTGAGEGGAQGMVMMGLQLTGAWEGGTQGMVMMGLQLTREGGREAVLPYSSITITCLLLGLKILPYFKIKSDVSSFPPPLSLHRW